MHSWNRWLAVLALLATTVLAWQGWLANKSYTKRDTMLRGATVGLNHLQIIFGFVLYFQSSLVAYLRSDIQGSSHIPGVAFFGVMHISVMVIAALLLTVGGAIARRDETEAKKFRTVAIFFTIALVLILLAIPSPISPFAVRPWMRLDF
jgi:cytochrome c biogenesis factor